MKRTLGQRCGGRVKAIAHVALGAALWSAMTGCGGLDGTGIPDFDASTFDGSTPDGFVVHHDGAAHHDGEAHHEGGHPDAISHVDSATDGPGGHDSGKDATSDAHHEGGVDGATDATVDSAQDGARDGSADVAVDAGKDSTTPPHDAGIDAPVNPCMDGVQDGNETGVDCGGGTCPACGVGVGCKVNTDCLPGDGCNAATNVCDIGLCTDGVEDGKETGVDCGGGTCPVCTLGKGCKTNADCVPGDGCDVVTKVCDSNECSDGIQDGNETAIDCGGGTCPGCGVGKACNKDSDCAAGAGCDVATKTCDDNLCNDGLKDGSETAIDCGGGTCPPCTVGQGCNTDADCVTGDGCDVTSKVCDGNLCNDGLKDGNETATDCGGGTCPPCTIGEACKVDSDCVTGEGCDATKKVCDANECSDGILDGAETAVDCGGGTCPGCAVGKACNVDGDCASPGGCDISTHKCDANECHDGLQDGAETDVDCGGGTCPTCPLGDKCKVTSDCVTGEGCDVTTHQCDANECNDGVQDGAETSVDCGGGTCPKCAIGQGCLSGTDCTSAYCFETQCAPVCTNASFQATGAQQQMTIATTGTYTITAYGSQGGASGYGTNGGNGDYVQASFTLTAGQTLQIVAGARTGSTGGNQGGGGGGGSFVYFGTAATPLPAEPLLVAGGGGGGNGGGGVVASGTGDGGGAGGGTGGGGGGTGWLTTGGSNGGNGGGHWGGGGGNSFAGTNGSAGGFGGGGGADVFNANGGGGGGGYTGGAGGGSSAATGGTSYVATGATAVTETAASHTGEGSVTVTGPIAASCTP